ncbi:DUF554 domain-containing protein [Nocardioidaceae bacterium]|nr:DUF554 domain-containing protein [Nocardioidaceae bacterium]
MFPGLGTLVNIATVLLGSGLGVLAGHRMPERTRRVVTDGLGLVTLLIAGSAMVAVADPALEAAVGTAAPMLIVLFSVLLGGIAGSLLRLEERLEGLGDRLRRRLGGSDDRFTEGFVVASLVFCVGPLTVLGSLYDGLGLGADALYLKAVLDGFAAIAFAAAFGWGVAVSALSVGTVQGSLTLLGLVIGNVLSEAAIAALTATGGVLLVGVALRLLDIRRISVVDLLPAFVLAPIVSEFVAWLH